MMWVVCVNDLIQSPRGVIAPLIVECSIEVDKGVCDVKKEVVNKLASGSILFVESPVVYDDQPLLVLPVG